MTWKVLQIMWYNKSRISSRICPTCHRVYKIGDVLQDLMDSEKEAETGSERQVREQELSGLCSAVCFVVACMGFPGAIKRAWGHTGSEIEREDWDMLNDERGGNETSRLLGLAVKMTRLDDLGLGQLCFLE